MLIIFFILKLLANRAYTGRNRFYRGKGRGQRHSLNRKLDQEDVDKNLKDNKYSCKRKLTFEDIDSNPYSAKHKVKKLHKNKRQTKEYETDLNKESLQDFSDQSYMHNLDDNLIEKHKTSKTPECKNNHIANLRNLKNNKLRKRKLTADQKNFAQHIKPYIEELKLEKVELGKRNTNVSNCGKKVITNVKDLFTPNRIKNFYGALNSNITSTQSNDFSKKLKYDLPLDDSNEIDFNNNNSNVIDKNKENSFDDKNVIDESNEKDKNTGTMDEKEKSNNKNEIDCNNNTDKNLEFIIEESDFEIENESDDKNSVISGINDISDISINNKSIEIKDKHVENIIDIEKKNVDILLINENLHKNQILDQEDKFLGEKNIKSINNDHILDFKSKDKIFCEQLEQKEGNPCLQLKITEDKIKLNNQSTVSEDDAEYYEKLKDTKFEDLTEIEKEFISKYTQTHSIMHNSLIKQDKKAYPQESFIKSAIKIILFKKTPSSSLGWIFWIFYFLFNVSFWSSVIIMLIFKCRDFIQRF